MATKAQKHFNKIMSELNLTNLTTQVLEFKLLTKTDMLRINSNKYRPNMPGTYGGIKVVLQFKNSNVYTFEVQFYGNNEMGCNGMNQPHHFYGLETVQAIINYINQPV
jgi:hypothetical protein